MLYYLHSLGCKVNSYETRAIEGSFLSRGYQKAKSIEEANIILINTCSVTSTADQKSRQHIRKFVRLAPKAVVIVMGCYSQKHAQECIDDGAAIVLGTFKRGEILFALDSFLKDSVPLNLSINEGRKAHYEEFGSVAFGERTRGYLKIQDGCDNFCSYCLIPYLRGNSRSREVNDTLAEAKRLVALGYGEIVLTGIHIGRYGFDLGDEAPHLSSLVRMILDNNPSLPRLRLGSLEESEIDEELLGLLKDSEVLASHLHIPLQSGSDEVLRKMGRHYDTTKFLSVINRIKEARPGIALTTDLIAGFPGESDENWQETLRFVAKCGFADVHVFPFSAREGTRAASFPEQVSPQVKEKRVHEMLELAKILKKAYETSLFGKALWVLPETYNEKTGLCIGHSSEYVEVYFKGKQEDVGQMNKVIFSPLNQQKQN